jgi:zinc/manganese transport system substrate-binding protein
LLTDLEKERITMKRFMQLGRILGVLLLASVPSEAKDQMNVVATLSTFGDLVRMIGGDFVTVASIASPKFNPHFIEPKPSDVLKVKRAQLLVHAGLDLELWRGPLLDAAGNTNAFPGAPGELDLSRGIALLEVPIRPVSRAEGDIHLYGNPHYWLNPENVRTMAQTVCDKLCALDPQHQEAYHRNLQAFLTQLDQKIAQWRSKLAPYKGREVIGYHNEWIYLMEFGGLTIQYFLEPKPGIPPTPQQVQLIERRIKEQRIPAIVQATYFPRRTAEVIAQRTGAKVVLLCQNVREMPECADYLALMDYNVNQLVDALREIQPLP